MEKTEKQTGACADSGIGRAMEKKLENQSPMTREEALQKRYRENVTTLAKKRQILTSVSNELTTMQIDIEASRFGSRRLTELLSKHDKASQKKEKKDRDFVDKLNARLRAEQDKIRDLGSSISRLEGQLVELRIDIELADSYVASLEALIGKKTEDDDGDGEREGEAKASPEAGPEASQETSQETSQESSPEAKKNGAELDFSWMTRLPPPHTDDSLPFPSAKGMGSVEIEDAEVPGKEPEEPEIRID